MDYDILVNKTHKLPDDYVPNDLVIIDGKYSIKGMARLEACNSFIKMASDALNLDLHIINSDFFLVIENLTLLYIIN